jgi:2-oxoglutarate ferredoxin oxidoreductase subunit beta
VTESDLMVHDETNRTLAGMLAAMQPPALPVALGVLYCDPAPAYDAQVAAQMTAAVGGAWPAPVGGNLDDLLRAGHTWTVE